ncbi:MAG: putative MutT/NUDIX-family protein [Ilumatobacteraceae bacterium]|nr:putative MutT/NUDIX-family protein [Ilumatobacteraceae bacterium]
MRDELHLRLLRLYQRMPTWARRRIVRTVAPSFTVGAMCFIERDDGAVLLVRQAYRQRWGVPGGLLERGEEAADGARREVFEEVGLLIDLVGEPRVVVDAEPQRVDVVYRARVADGMDPAVAAPRSPEILEARWFPREALPELQHETVTALLALARPGPNVSAPALGADVPGR